MVDATRLILRWPKTVHVWRTFGRSDNGPLRYGFMHKDGVRDDAVNAVHPHFGVGYVLRGSGVYHDAAGQSWPMAPGSVFQRIPGRRHSTILDPASRWAECYLSFGADLSRSLIDEGMIDPGRPVIERGLDLQLAERVLSGLVSLRVAGTADLPRELGHMLALLGDLTRVPTSPVGSDERLVAEACARLGDDLARPRSPRQVARDLGCDYERLRKTFRRITGVAPQHWRMRRRMELARELLLDPALSIARVGTMVGFSDPTLFATRFRAYSTSSPRAFRNANR